ncbi:hypothetical protein Rsub_02776 [Raphidocelis subcapitata]|uniref:Uncharacterized protein n=1 Tax=Raphidocelis subcapitata TaxID=307507 RepID=A0A2V0NQW9_9CHLO|nr:hypothetical protein Rsub_02776 [Raphidocelis subcapitata]|eukprot:GBF90068.1 hypothetical protein Rsub_02776 [Raphidocelis subcapitata]
MAATAPPGATAAGPPLPDRWASAAPPGGALAAVMLRRALARLQQREGSGSGLGPPPPPPPPQPRLPPATEGLPHPSILISALLAAAAGTGGAAAAARRRMAAAALSRAERAAGVAEWHASAEAEARRRREEARAQRLSALRSSDMEAYKDLLRETRNTQLSKVLSETDACLHSLMRRLNVPAAPQRRATGAADPAGKEGAGASSAWALLAEQLAAAVEKQPEMLEGGELRSYQMQGLCWMAGLAIHGVNGILADEMGLGKTVQVIALICHLAETHTGPGLPPPFLIAAPASVLPNWAAELARWAPGLRVIARGARFHVLLTSYDYLMAKNDRPRLARGREWRCIVIDEGHRLKNADCKLARELRHYRSRMRLLLTGTPLQNKLDELWALLNFLMPDMFDSADDFAAWFGAPLEALRDGGGAARGDAEDAEDAAGLSGEEYLLLTSRLHTVLRPFMLRRLKEAVAGELPGKTEVIIRCGMGTYQQTLYDLVKRSFSEAGPAGSAGGGAGGGGGLGAAAGTGGGGGARGLGVSVNNTLMELRSICNDPLISRLHPLMGETLLPPSPLGLPPGLRLSAKLEALDRVLLRMAAGRHKARARGGGGPRFAGVLLFSTMKLVLLFSTMTRVLDELEAYAQWRGFSSLRLDGGSGGARERGELVARFNDPAAGVFIFFLSIRAGGVGLNLQAADTVVMYDSDFNPQIDLQAQARAYRIGQTRPVLVVRLLVSGSVEEHVMRVAAEKARFADSSITGGFFDGMTTPDERRRYLLSILNAPPGTAAAGPKDAPGAGGGGGGGGGPSDAELDRLLARGDAEVALFAQETAHRAAAEAAALERWRAARGGGGGGSAAAAAGGAPEAEAVAAGTAPPARLAGAEECAELIREAVLAAAPKPREDLSQYGRGMRSAPTRPRQGEPVAPTGQAAAAAAAASPASAPPAPAPPQQQAAAADADAPPARRPRGRPRKVPRPQPAAVAAEPTAPQQPARAQQQEQPYAEPEPAAAAAPAVTGGSPVGGARLQDPPGCGDASIAAVPVAPAVAGAPRATGEQPPQPRGGTRAAAAPVAGDKRRRGDEAVRPAAGAAAQQVAPAPAPAKRARQGGATPSQQECMELESRPVTMAAACQEGADEEAALISRLWARFDCAIGGSGGGGGGSGAAAAAVAAPAAAEPAAAPKAALLARLWVRVMRGAGPGCGSAPRARGAPPALQPAAAGRAARGEDDPAVVARLWARFGAATPLVAPAGAAQVPPSGAAVHEAAAGSGGNEAEAELLAALCKRFGPLPAGGY